MLAVDEKESLVFASARALVRLPARRYPTCTQSRVQITLSPSRVSYQLVVNFLPLLLLLYK